MHLAGRLRYPGRIQRAGRGIDPDQVVLRSSTVELATDVQPIPGFVECEGGNVQCTGGDGRVEVGDGHRRGHRNPRCTLAFGAADLPEVAADDEVRAGPQQGGHPSAIAGAGRTGAGPDLGRHVERRIEVTVAAQQACQSEGVRGDDVATNVDMGGVQRQRVHVVAAAKRRRPRRDLAVEADHRDAVARLSLDLREGAANEDGVGVDNDRTHHGAAAGSDVHGEGQVQ